MKTKRTLIFMRHGETDYTGQFPDLTDKGKAQTVSAATEIAKIMEDRKSVRIISSPTPRALGTAGILITSIGLPLVVEQEFALRCMDVHDPAAATDIWTSFELPREIDLAYEWDARFEEGLVVERRSEIQRRFFRYLGSKFEEFVWGSLPDVTVHVSHFEVLWRLAAMSGLCEPLKYGEIIQLDLDLTTANGSVNVWAKFRNCQWEFECRLPTALFAEQFN